MKIIKNIENLGDNKFYIKIICKDNDSICSTLIGKIEGNAATICKVNTEKKYQFQGIGRNMVKEFESIVYQKGCDFIKLISSDVESDKFWRKNKNFKSIDSSNFIKELSAVHD